MRSTATPSFYHQLGHNDQKRCLGLLRNGLGSGAIISPRDLKKEHLLTQWAEEYHATSTELIIDPQFYTSSSAQDHLHADEVENTQRWVDPNVSRPLLYDTMNRQQGLKSTTYLIPSPFAQSMTDAWLTTLSNFAIHTNEWRASVESGDTSVFATLPIHVHVVEDKQERYQLLNAVSGLDVDGFYVVSNIPTHPSSPHLLYGLLDIVFRLKRLGFKILLGYTEPWAMITFPFGVDGFASSGLKNRRTFQHEQFGRRGGNTGGRGPQFFNFWSPAILGHIRFPDDAEVLRKSGLWKSIYTDTYYADIFERQSPAEAFRSKTFSLTESHSNYSVMMQRLGVKYQNMKYQERIDLTRDWVSRAKALRKRIDSLGIAVREHSNYYDDWVESLDRYTRDSADDIKDEYPN